MTLSFLGLFVGISTQFLSTEERFEYRGNATEMVPFQNCVCDCGLEDVKYNGSYFTLNNKQEGKDRVYAKLDRVLGNNDWLEKFSTAEVTFLPERDFDHSPAFLSIYPRLHDKKKPFRYFNYWSSLRDFSDVVKTGWQEIIAGSPMYRLVTKLKLLKYGFKGLNQQGRGDIGVQDIEAYKALIDIQLALRVQPGNGDLIAKEIQARRHYAKTHRNYLNFLRQKSKIAWLTYGDDNTKLFQASIKKRRLQNTIYSIKDANGTWLNEQNEVIRAFVDFNENMLG
ncbi:uncharacterized protein LOC133818935 [Humulus lupulus]|uniref:uncharacterized protein LOC133818935 n=1 Tax=Humulus lupulus TaxID=3486 RepID=UPI002B4058EA|nr:uncharacterized protein LOC133818935 [Humulus lupulus]